MPSQKVWGLWRVSHISMEMHRFHGYTRCDEMGCFHGHTHVNQTWGSVHRDRLLDGRCFIHFLHSLSRKPDMALCTVWVFFCWEGLDSDSGWVELCHVGRNGMLLLSITSWGVWGSKSLCRYRCYAMPFESSSLSVMQWFSLSFDKRFPVWVLLK